jgi:hypothetical protein
MRSRQGSRFGGILYIWPSSSCRSGNTRLNDGVCSVPVVRYRARPADARPGDDEPGDRTAAYRRQQRGQPGSHRDRAECAAAAARAWTGHRLQRANHHRGGGSDPGPFCRSIGDDRRAEFGHGDRPVRLRPGGRDRQACRQPDSRRVPLCRRQAQQAGKCGHGTDTRCDDRNSRRRRPGETGSRRKPRRNLCLWEERYRHRVKRRLADSHSVRVADHRARTRCSPRQPGPLTTRCRHSTARSARWPGRPPRWSNHHPDGDHRR